MEKTADAAVKLVDEKKDEWVDSAVNKSKEYVDSKLSQNREATIKKLVQQGYARSDIDANDDGDITDDELAAFMKANPKTLLYGGGAGVAFLALWYLMQQAARLKGQVPDPQPQPPTG